MLIVETIAKIRRMFRDQHSIREISRELRLSRKALRSDATAFAYKRQRQPRPQLDSHVAQLEALLAEELAKPKRQRLSYVRLFEILRADAFAGGYDSVPDAGLEAVAAACAAALAARLHSADAVLNLLARDREPEPPAPVLTPSSLTLGLTPVADCARYDGLRTMVPA